MDSFIYSLNATVPVFAVMLVGYFLRRIGMLTEDFVAVANKFVFKVCLPCMLFLDLWATDIRHSFDGEYIGFCAVITLISILGIWILAKLFLRINHRSEPLYSARTGAVPQFLELHLSRIYMEIPVWDRL